MLLIDKYIIRYFIVKKNSSCLNFEPGTLKHNKNPLFVSDTRDFVYRSYITIDLLLLEIVHRIDRISVNSNFKMEMRSCSYTGTAYKSDGLPLNICTFAYQQFAAMAVQGGVSAAVVDDDIIPVSGSVSEKITVPLLAATIAAP